MPRSPNMQMFAMRQAPPWQLHIAGLRCRLARVFKHDFFAATCLYEVEPPRGRDAAVVVKFMRTQPFCGLSMEWLGRFLARHEELLYAALAGVPGVPRWIARIGQTGFAIEYIDGRPLDHQPPPGAGFFDRLRELVDTVHARGVAYCDMNKRSNVLVGQGGRPFLIDYQISVRRRDDLPRPLRWLSRRWIEYLQKKDLYHLYKHKRRIAPQELRPDEETISRRITAMHWVHRKLTDPWRALRRWFLGRQHRRGALVSPTATMEDHHQPEKATWRTPQ